MEDALKESLLDELAHQLELIGKLKPGSEEYEACMRGINDLTKSVNSLDQTEMDAFDKQERREADKVKNQQLLELEKQKSKLSWDRVTFEMAKIGVPLIGSGILYLIAQRNVFQFEETGRIVTTGGRELHLPNIWRWFK